MVAIVNLDSMRHSYMEKISYFLLLMFLGPVVFGNFRSEYAPNRREGPHGRVSCVDETSAVLILISDHIGNLLECITDAFRRVESSSDSIEATNSTFRAMT